MSLTTMVGPALRDPDDDEDVHLPWDDGLVHLMSADFKDGTMCGIDLAYLGDMMSADFDYWVRGEHTGTPVTCLACLGAPRFE